MRLIQHLLIANNLSRSFHLQKHIGAVCPKPRGYLKKQWCSCVNKHRRLINYGLLHYFKSNITRKREFYWLQNILSARNTVEFLHKWITSGTCYIWNQGLSRANCPFLSALSKHGRWLVWWLPYPIRTYPANSGEVPSPTLHITIYLPFSPEQEIWQQADTAAIQFCHDCTHDTRISLDFRTIYKKNSDALANLQSKIKPSGSGYITFHLTVLYLMAVDASWYDWGQWSAKHRLSIQRSFVARRPV